MLFLTLAVFSYCSLSMITLCALISASSSWIEVWDACCNSWSCSSIRQSCLIYSCHWIVGYFLPHLRAVWKVSLPHGILLLFVFSVGEFLFFYFIFFYLFIYFFLSSYTLFLKSRGFISLFIYIFFKGKVCTSKKQIQNNRIQLNSQAGSYPQSYCLLYM